MLRGHQCTSKQMKLQHMSKAVVWVPVVLVFSVGSAGTRRLIMSMAVGLTAQSPSVHHARAPSALAES